MRFSRFRELLYQADGRGMASGSSTPTRLVLNVEGDIVGYHVYQRIWNPVIDEVATAVREEDNVHDRKPLAFWKKILVVPWVIYHARYRKSAITF